ncbi:hypothetical protein [Campylobacter fetus]|uniref:hypothetical protein n=1 Tax=Campylobacter fetus TaxID=196 RepID=UPI0026DFE43D|nr:hypothetical protein [Campylobacter fetus]WKW25464.1 hypothetical protein IXZ12_02815 [Campylobacter fetus subsp. venerealis]
MLNKTDVSMLYITIMGMASEGDGNKYWLDYANNNSLGVSSLANIMLDSPGAAKFFGDSLLAGNEKDFVTKIYSIALGNTSDVDGINYWTKAITGGGEFTDSKGNVISVASLSKGDLIGAMINSMVNGGSAESKAIFEAKAAASDYFADATLGKDISGLDEGTTSKLISEINSASDLDKVKSEIDALKSELPNPGSTYDLTEGNDNLKGTDLDDTFNGTTYVGNGTNKSTLSAFDKIDGGAGRDTLNAQVLANNSASDAKLKSEDLVKALAGVTNVESVNIVTDLPNDTAITLNSGSTGMANLALDVLGSKLAGLTTDISGKLNIKVNGSVDALTAANAKSVNVDAVGAVTLTDTKAATNVNVKAAGDVTLTDTEAASSISVDANGTGKVTLTKATNVENLSVKNATNLTITAGGDKLNTVTLENVTLGDSRSAAAAIDFKGATTLNFNNVKMIDGSDSKIAHIKSSAETLNLNFSGKRLLLL